jgi:hypothetical protein
MKNWMITITLIFVAQASFADLAAEDFNQMIQENQKSEQDLRQKLQKGAGIEFKDKYGKIERDKFKAPNEAEQVVVSSGSQWKTSPHKKDRTAKALQKAEMNRLSQELNEANSN